MKKLIITILVSLLVAGNQSFAQQEKDKEHSKVEKEKQEKVKEVKKSTVQEKDKDKTKAEKDTGVPGKGHAYGKNKGDLQGKDFGQNRAAEAKSKHDALKNADENVEQTSSMNNDTREKIKQAREKLETKKKDKTISDADYKEKKKAIDDLEKELDKVEQQNKEVKDQLNKEK